MAATPPPPVDYTRRHLRFGWWSLGVFLSLGLLLEVLHGFKVGFYLDVDNEHRRLMWTLAHAHGGLLGLVHVLFGLTLMAAPPIAADRRAQVSGGLITASVLLPAGFFAAGLRVTGLAPALAFLVVPVGGALLMTVVFLVARAADRLP